MQPNSKQDWRILLSQYCEEQSKEKRKELFETIKHLALKLVGENLHTFYPETYSDRAKEVAIEVFCENTKHGSYLVPPHGEMIWNGNKEVMVRAELFEGLYKDFSFLCAGKRCYGIIRYKVTYEISLDEFERLKKKHRITDEERDAWWPKASKLYCYPIRDFFRFKKPNPINLPQGIQASIKNTKQYFKAIEADPKQDSSVCLSLPTPIESEKALLSMDLQDLFSYSIAMKDNDKSRRSLDGMSSIELLIEHAEIHEVAEEKLYETGEIGFESITWHSGIAGEMISRGMEHRNETTLDYDSPLLDGRPLLKITALGTRGNVEEWSQRHKNFTGVLLQVRNKTILLDCGVAAFLKKKPDLVILSSFHSDCFPWQYGAPKKPGILRELNLTELSQLETEHDIYVEPFCSTSALFAKKPSKLEIINDSNPDVVKALRFIKQMTKAHLVVLKRQKWAPRQDTWKKNRKIWEEKKFKNTTHWFYIYKYLLSYPSLWAGGETEEPFKPESLWKIHLRLRKVKIFCRDAAEIIRMYDSPKTLVFINPPPGTNFKWNSAQKDFADLKSTFVAAEEKKVPDVTFIAHPYSKCEVSKRAEEDGFDIQWGEKYGFDAFEFEAIPITHSKLAPAVCWKIKIADKTIIFMPNVLEFDKNFIKDADIYIGDGTVFTKSVTTKDKTGHLSICEQLEITKEQGVKNIYFIHCGKEVIESPELEDKIAEMGARVMHDGGIMENSIQLIKLKDVLEKLQDRFSTIEKYFLVGSLVTSGRGIDIDIVERGEVDNAARHRISKMLQPFSDRISFIRNDAGPWGSYIPCYKRTYEKFGEGFVIMSSDSCVEGQNFTSTVLTDQAVKEAQISRWEDKIIPGRFFALQKTHADYHQREVLDLGAAIEMLHSDKFPCVGEEKIDGMHIKIQWDGLNLIFYSEDGKLQPITIQAPELTKAFDGKKAFIGVGKLDAWIPKEKAVKARLVSKERKARDGKVHLGHGDLTGYMRSGIYKEVIAKNLVLHIYDVLWTKESPELFKEPLSERMKVRNSILPAHGMVQTIKSTILSDAETIVRYWKQTMKLPFAEGILLKPLKDRYVLWHSGGCWIKIKALSELDAQVLKIEQAASKPNVWNAICAITDSDGKFTYIGRIFNTLTHIKLGDIIGVRFQSISKYTDPDTGRIWYNWFRPSVIDIHREMETPSSCEIAEQLVKATDGKVDMKRLPRIAKEIFGNFTVNDLNIEEHSTVLSELSVELSLGLEDLVEVVKEPPIPDSMKSLIKRATSISRDVLLKKDSRSLPKGFYVIQNHFRGKTTHLDLRIKSDGNLDGETLLNQVAGKITEPIITLEQARAFSIKCHSAQASEYTKFHPKMLPHEGIMITDKGVQPLEWATKVKTIYEPGKAGATKEFPDVFWGEDWGIAYRTVEKPWFIETWLYGKWFNGARLIERMLQRTDRAQKGKKSTYWRAMISNPKSPPYIFSPSFFKNTEWIPKDSALPPHWEAIIPQSLKWWGKAFPAKKRLNLIKATFNYLIEEGFLKGRKKELDSDEFGIILKVEKRSYAIHRIWWRGFAHVRYLPVSVWQLRIEHEDGSLLTFEFEGDPTRESQKGFAALRFISKTKPPGGKKPSDWLKYSGKLFTRHPENPNKKLVANVVIEDSGNFRPVLDSKDFLSGYFSGKEFGLKGYYIAKRENPDSSFWLFKKSSQGEHYGN